MLTWLGIIFCISQSAMFSGLNLALFSTSRLRIEIEAAQGNKQAIKVLSLRKDSNYLLTTILWGNVGINVLLALLSNSVMAGITAFLFSTVAITILGEIIPQAYFSRNAIRMSYYLSPLLHFYKILLFPLSKPTSLLLDKWLGKEGIQFFNESELRELLRIHIKSKKSDVDAVEGTGALNFLTLDDLRLTEEGEEIDKSSIIRLPFKNKLPVFPNITHTKSDEFLKLIQKSGKKWVIIINDEGLPKMILNTDRFIKSALFNEESFNPYAFCHKPIIVTENKKSLGEIIPRLEVLSKHAEDDVIEKDVFILWGDEKRIITGTDILGRLLRGIVKSKVLNSL